MCQPIDAFLVVKIAFSCITKSIQNIQAPHYYYHHQQAATDTVKVKYGRFVN